MIIHWIFSSPMDSSFKEVCTVSFSLSSARGRGRPWWPRRTRSWAPSASGPSTLDTSLPPHLWPSPNPEDISLMMRNQNNWWYTWHMLYYSYNAIDQDDWPEGMWWEQVSSLSAYQSSLCPPAGQALYQPEWLELVDNGAAPDKWYIIIQMNKISQLIAPTSGYHLALTFSKLAGFTREKQIRNTSWSCVIK